MITEKFSMDVLAIGTDDGKQTYEIRRKWADKGKKGLVIELYPTISASRCETLDLSTMHLMNHVRDFGWSEVRIVNLYATVVDSKPRVSELKEDSLAYIEELLEEKDINTYEIVVAWGNSLSTHRATNNAKIDFLTMLKKKGLLANVKCISVDELKTQKPFGIHPLYLGLHHSYDTWKLVKYPLDKMLSELEGKVKPVQVDTKKTEKKKTKETKEDKADDTTVLDEDAGAGNQ